MPENKTSAAARGAPIKETGRRGANAPPEPTAAPEKPGAAALAALCADTSDYRRAATDLEYFGKYYLPHYFSLPAPPFHRALDALWRSRVMDGADPVRDTCRILSKTGTRTAVAAPRGHAKSTVMSLKNALHAALYGYKHYILLVSDTETQAVGFLDAIKSELEENPRILRDFGEQPGKKTWKTSSILLANGCRIDAVGSGQKLRGRRNHERRPDLILCDDIENDEGVRTAEQRDKLAAWFYKAVCKSGDRYTDILMIGTVLHHDALLARVLKTRAFSRAPTARSSRTAPRRSGRTGRRSTPTSPTPSASAPRTPFSTVTARKCSPARASSGRRSSRTTTCASCAWRKGRAPFSPRCSTSP